MTVVHTKGEILTLQPSRSSENGFPTLKSEANSSWKNIKMKLTLLIKAPKVIHFTDFFLCACSMYSHFESELKK